ncbi:MAG TPA: hypothetical protein VHX92_07580 [Rhizomicrobium sp.]|jgi:hypothetical protein|nr:hypothetical protein [Rhizomicrobium sp.]
MPTAFSHVELTRMLMEAELRKPPNPDELLYESAEKVISVNSSTHDGLFLSTLVKVEGERSTYLFNPAVAWHIALTISQLLSLTGWTDEEGNLFAPDAKHTEFTKPTMQEKVTMRQTFERFIPLPPGKEELKFAPMVVAVTGGAGPSGAVLSFRLEDDQIATVVMNQFVTYRLFAMLVDVIESCDWIGKDGKLEPNKPLHQGGQTGKGLN